MKEIVNWLVGIERLAATFYGEVSENYKGDENISAFFRQLSAEETWHVQIMENAAEHLKNNGSTPPSIHVDSATEEKIETPFMRNRELLSAGNMDKKNLMECLAVTEFSEWNDIFLYVMNSLKKERKFMPVAARIQQHRKEIENFLRSMPEGQKHLYTVMCLPSVWKEQILVINDEDPIVEFLEGLLFHEGSVEIARNGKEGLDKVREKYFDVIISDVDLPVMNGIDFYNRASADDPHIGERIMFFTDPPGSKDIAFLRKNNLRYLIKPAPVKEILKGVNEICRRAKRA
jgi:CheY-like chemotaxis protein/rubrerythrin